MADSNQANSDCGDESNSLTRLTIKIDMGHFIRKAALIDARRGEDEIDDGEGVDICSPPPSKPSPINTPPSSPLSTPPSSPELLLSLKTLPPPLAFPDSPVATQPPPHLPSGKTDSRRRKQTIGAASRRQKKRAEAKEVRTPFSYRIKPALSRIWCRPLTTKIKYAIELLPHSPNPFEGKRQPQDRASPWTLPELKARGFRLVEWDGW